MRKYQIKAPDVLLLSKFDPDDTGEFKKTAKDKDKAKTLAKEYIEKMDQLQERLYADGSRSLLIVLQGMESSRMPGRNIQDAIGSRTKTRFFMARALQSPGKRTNRYLQPFPL